MIMRLAAAGKARLVSLAWAVFCGFAVAQSGCGSLTGCGGLSGYGNAPFTGCGGGQNIPPQSSINFLGTNGTVFRATIADTTASYSFQATVPLKVIYVNNVPPIRIVATDLSAKPSLLSVQALSGALTTQFASTSTPGATISVNVGGPLALVPGPPGCDVRFVVNGPINQTYTALLEQNNNAYEAATTAPTLYIVGSAHGNVDGIFTDAFPKLGPLEVQLVIDGNVAQYGAGTVFTVKGGCP
jgi:hypothetical protein